MQKEVEGVGKVLENPKRPLVVIVGGAKLETKLPLKRIHFTNGIPAMPGYEKSDYHEIWEQEVRAMHNWKSRFDEQGV